MNEPTVKTGVYTDFNGEEKTFSFYTSLDASDKLAFVNTVTDLLVTENYNYIVKDLMFDFAIIEVFAIDVDTNYITESVNPLREIEKLVEETGIVSIVKLNAEDGVIEALEKAVEINVEYRTGIHRNPIVESLSNLLDSLESKLNNIDFEDLMGVAQLLTGASDQLNPESIVDAYANSDVFKQQYESLFSDMMAKNGMKSIEGGKKYSGKKTSSKKNNTSSQTSSKDN